MTVGTRLHRRAQRLARRIGQSMTITHTVQAYDNNTGLVTPTSTLMTGTASPDDQDHSELYQSLGLVTEKTVTFLFTPDTYGQRPRLGGRLTYSGELRTIRHVAPLDLDGNAIISRVTAST